MVSYKWCELNKQSTVFHFKAIDDLGPPLPVFPSECEVRKKRMVFFEIVSSSPFFVHTYNDYSRVIDTAGIKLYKRPLIFIDKMLMNIYNTNNMELEDGLEFKRYHLKDDHLKLNLKFENKTYIVNAYKENDKWIISSVKKKDLAS